MSTRREKVGKTELLRWASRWTHRDVASVDDLRGGAVFVELFAVAWPLAVERRLALHAKSRRQLAAECPAYASWSVLRGVFSDLLLPSSVLDIEGAKVGRFKACYPLLVLPYFASMLARVPPGQDFSCEFAHPVDPSLSDFLASPRLIHSLLRGGGIPPLPKSIAAPETPNTSPPRKLKAAGADRPKPKQEARLKPQDTQEECRGGTEGQPSKEGARGEAAALSESRPSEAGGEKAADREPAAAKPSSMDGQGGQHSEDDDLAGESIPLQGIAPFPDMAGGKAQHGGRDGEDGRPLKEEAEDKTGKGGRRLEASAGQVSGSMEARRGLEGPDRDRPLSPSHICSQASSHEPEGADLRVSYREPEVVDLTGGGGSTGSLRGAGVAPVKNSVVLEVLHRLLDGLSRMELVSPDSTPSRTEEMPPCGSGAGGRRPPPVQHEEEAVPSIQGHAAVAVSGDGNKEAPDAVEGTKDDTEAVAGQGDASKDNAQAEAGVEADGQALSGAGDGTDATTEAEGSIEAGDEARALGEAMEAPKVEAVAAAGFEGKDADAANVSTGGSPSSPSSRLLLGRGGEISLNHSSDAGSPMLSGRGFTGLDASGAGSLQSSGEGSGFMRPLNHDGEVGMRRNGSKQLSNSVLHAAWARGSSKAEASAVPAGKWRREQRGRAGGTEVFQRVAIELRCCADDLEAILAEEGPVEEAADSCQGRLARLVCWLGPFEGPQLGEQGQVIREEDCRSGAGSPETSAEHRWEAPADQHWPDSHGGSSLDLSREAERVAMDIAALVASSSENEEVAAADLPQQDAPESALKDPFSLPQAPSPVRSRLLRGAVSPERPPAKRGGASFTSDVGSSPLGQAAGKDRLLRHRPIGRHRHTHSAGDTRHGFLMPGFGSTPETQRRLAPGNTQRPRSPSPTRGAPFGYTVDSPASTPGRMTPRATQTVAAKGRAGPSSAVQGHQAENRQSPTAKELLNTSMDAGLDMLKVWTALYEGSDEEQQYEDHIHVHLHTSFDDSLVLAPPASPRRPAGPLMGPHEQAVSSGAPGRSEGLALSQHEEMASHWSLSSEGRELSQLSQQLLDLGAEEGGASWASPTQSLETSKSRMSVESSVDLSAVIRHTTDPAPPQRQHPTSAASVGFPMLPWSLQEGESLSQVLQRSLSWRNVRKSEGGSSLRPSENGGAPRSHK